MGSFTIVDFRINWHSKPVRLETAPTGDMCGWKPHLRGYIEKIEQHFNYGSKPVRLETAPTGDILKKSNSISITVPNRCGWKPHLPGICAVGNRTYRGDEREFTINFISTETVYRTPQSVDGFHPFQLAMKSSTLKS